MPKLAAMTDEERAQLPGRLAGRAPQLLAGAIVAEAAMDLFERRRRSQVCPWALREGVILRRLDWIAAGADRRDAAARLGA